MSELDTTITSEGNTDQENEVLEAGVETQEGSDSAEGKKIAAILKRKNDKIAELEAQLKGDSGTEAKAEVKEPSEGLSKAEAILYAQGLTEEEVNKASTIAKIENVKLNDAINGDLFVAWKKTKDDKIKSEKASIGTSNGSAKVAEKKGFDTPGLSSEEHLALFRNQSK